MSEAFVVLWSLERCRWLKKVRDTGPLEVIFGGPHTSQPSLDSVSEGDVIYPICVQSGTLHLIARMTVQSLVPPEEFVQMRWGISRPQGRMWDEVFRECQISRASVGHRLPITCCDIAAVGQSGSDIRFDRTFPGELLESLRFGPTPSKERPLSGVADGKLKSSLTFQGHVRRLNFVSAELFDEHFS